jgi:hypothetical protein
MKGGSTYSNSTNTQGKSFNAEEKAVIELGMQNKMQEFLKSRGREVEIKYEELKSSPNFAIKIFQKAIYYGELKNDHRHGRGCMAYQNGRVYEGFWFDDKRHGNGFERYTNGNTYEGYFKNGKAHGRGEYIKNISNSSSNISGIQFF